MIRGKDCTLIHLAWIALLLATASVLSASDSDSLDRLAVVLADDASRAVTEHGLDAVEHFDGAGSDVLVVRLGSDDTVSSLRTALGDDSNILAVDAVFTAAIEPSLQADDLAGAGDASGLASSGCIDRYLDGGPWAGWAVQSAAVLARIEAAQTAAGHCGEGVTVAVIDTGVDADHPLLAGAVLRGYDFLAETASLSAEWSGVDATQMAIVEDSLRASASATQMAIVEQSVQEMVHDSNLDATQMAIVETGTISVFLAADQVESFEKLGLPPLFGHGTMVAALVRLVAPGAEILPLRTFDGYGRGLSTDIVRAVYYAVDHGADVINMSFSMERQSPAMLEALRYARRHGVVVAAAAGNRSSNELTFPASESSVMGVAASDFGDKLAGFSNYGPQNADLLSPGVAIISAFPGGHYAAGWGTSFATPFVAGTAALLRFGLPDDAATQRATVENVLASVELLDLHSKVLTGGRLDAAGAVFQLQN